MAEFETKYLAHHGVKGFDDSIYSQTMDAADDFLAHYQVKGAKHGIRRYQNYDGTLTAEGRIHYGVGPPREKKSEDSGVKKAAEGVKKKIGDAVKARKDKKRANLKEYLRDHPKKLPKYKRVITEDEAYEIIHKINFDRKLQDIKYSEQDRKAERFNKLVGRVGDFKNLLAHGTSIYNNTANIYNGLLYAGKIGDSRFSTYRSSMMAKYGDDYMTKMTDDERSSFYTLKASRDSKIMPKFDGKDPFSVSAPAKSDDSGGSGGGKKGGGSGGSSGGGSGSGSGGGGKKKPK